MKIVMLVEAKMQPIPATVTVLNDWDTINIHTGMETGIKSGKHMYLEATPEEFTAWLKPFDGVWVGVGAPQLQQFEVAHIK